MSRLVSIFLAALMVWAGVVSAAPQPPVAPPGPERTCGCDGCDPAACCCIESAPAGDPHPLEALPAGSASFFHSFEFLSVGGTPLPLPKRLEELPPAPAFLLPWPGPVALFQRDCAWLI